MIDPAVRVGRTRDLSLIRPLRAAVLRPNLPPSESVYPGDDDPRSFHYLLEIENRSGPEPVWTPIVVASFLPEVFSLDTNSSAMRLRGMATQAGYRGKGLGQRLLRKAFMDLEDNGVELVWCNARVAAQTFYLREGFTNRSEVFELPQIGPHTVMVRYLSKNPSR